MPSQSILNLTKMNKRIKSRKSSIKLTKEEKIVFEEITLNFKNALEVMLPKRITEELEGVRLETWPGYPQGDIVLILSQLIPEDSGTFQDNMRKKSFLIKKSHLVNKLEGKGLIFSKNWIEKNISSNYIRVTEDCVLQ